jgi:hypothetical protein
MIVKAGRGLRRDLGAGPLQALIDSFELYLRTERKSAKTIRTYTEAAQWFASRLLTGFAAEYACGHCTAHTRSAALSPRFVLVDVFHDPECPVLRGLVDDFPATVRALSTARFAKPVQD